MSTGAPPGGPPFDIPDFTISGVLPPYLGPTPTILATMSPYATTLVRIANKLCKSDERREIFRGLLAWRRELEAIGFQNGFQWLSGSFMEDIETLETRHPRDVDVVTFLHRPPGLQNDADWNAFVSAHFHLFDQAQVKATYKCDVYFIDMDIPDPPYLVSQARYWFGLFSHRRHGLWKGMLEVSLAVSADDTDAALLVTP